MKKQKIKIKIRRKDEEPTDRQLKQMNKYVEKLKRNVDKDIQELKEEIDNSLLEIDEYDT